MSNYPANCPILEQTADGVCAGRCWHLLTDGECPRHGDVREEVRQYCETGKGTLENTMRKRKGLKLLGGAR